MAGKCEHGLTTKECLVCASPKYGDATSEKSEQRFNDWFDRCAHPLRYDERGAASIVWSACESLTERRIVAWAYYPLGIAQTAVNVERERQAALVPNDKAQGAGGGLIAGGSPGATGSTALEET